MKITLRSQKLGLVTREGNASTLKDVKELFADSGIDFSNVQFIDRATKGMYVVDDAKIPNVEEILFLLAPLKNKSGANLEEVRNMGYSELRTLGSSLNKNENAEINLNGKTEDVKKAVVNYLLSKTPNTDSDEDVYEAAKGQICAIIDDLKDKGASPQVATEVVVAIMGLTESEIDAEYNNLIKQIS